MIHRLRQLHQTQHLVLSTVSIGTMLLLAYLTDTTSARLWTALAFLASGAGILVASRIMPNALRVVYIMSTLGGALGMIALHNDLVWWVAVAGFSLIPIFSAPAIKQFDYSLITIGAAIIGIVLMDPRQWDLIILGLSVMSIGQIVRFVMYEPTREDGSTISRLAMFPVEVPAISPDELANITTRIHVTADGVVRAAHAIQEVTTQQSDGASEQVDVLQMTNAMLDSFLELSEQINQKARDMTQTAQQTTQVSQDGQNAIRDAIEGMNQIREQVTAIATTIVTLAQLTRRVDEIITSVSEIATQSNLLALNASIEAARAGIHGRGFAIVAEEVRSLSQQSTNAAHQVRQILKEIQEAVKQTISATEVGMNGVDSGVSKTQDADQIMLQLAANVDVSHQAMNEIYAVIRKQAEGLEEIAISMERVDRITQQNLASTRMVSTVSQNLNRLADDLQNAVNVGQTAL